MRNYRSVSIFSEHARECCRALSTVVIYDRTLRFSCSPTRDKRARRCCCERKPGRYANRENGRERWISRISEGLMDIRILSVPEDYFTSFLLFDLAVWLMHSRRSCRLSTGLSSSCVLSANPRVSQWKCTVSARNLRLHVKNIRKRSEMWRWGW